MSAPNSRLLKSTLLLLWSFAFGFNAAKFLHELGHAIAYWITGGTIERIIIHPFAWSYTYPGSFSNYPSFTTWAGVVFCTLMGILLFAMVWRWRSPYVILALVTGVVGCVHSGVYLIYDCLAKSGGDATTLVHYGTSKIVIILVGLLMMVIGVILAGMSLRLIGIRSTDGVKARILVLGGGLLPYLIATLLYQWLYSAEELGMWLIKGVSIAVLVLLFGVLSAIVQRRVRRLRYAEATGVTWLAVIVANFGAVVILSVIFILLRSHKPETTMRYLLNYYDHQSNFAGINQKITHNPTASPGKRYHSESVVFWNWQGRQGKTKIPHLTRLAAICPDSNEIIVQTIPGVLIVPMDEGPRRWAFKRDNILLLSRWAISNNSLKVLVYGFDSDLRKYVLIALDILNGHTTKFEISDSPWEVIFIDESTAIASVGEDIIKVEFAESGEHEFSVDQGAGRKGEVMAVFRGDFVFHQPVIWTEENTDQHTVECGAMKIPFAEPVKYVLASESYIWAIDKNGQVFKINSDGSKLSVGTYAPNEMIGRGIFDDSFWIAFSDGTIRIFGDSEGTAKIELP